MGRKTRLAGMMAAAAIAFVGTWEGLRLTAYRDIVGIPTVCYGETRGAHLGDRYTRTDCDAMLLASLRRHEAGMRRCLNASDRLPEKTYIAFVSLAYNIGVGAFCRSTAARRLNAGDIRGACEAASWFDKAGGRKVRGLVRRRAAEHALCVEGLR